MGLTKLTVQFTGLLGLTVEVRDAGGVIYSGLLLLPGSTFEVESSAGPGMPFVGDQVIIRTTLLVLADISTSCSNPVGIGTTFGNFRVTAGESVGGQPICCNVMETTPPVISGCPSNITLSADDGACGTNVGWTEPTVIDNCAVANFSRSHNPGDFFAVGVTPVVYTATDNYGNISTCTFDIIVNDDTAPVFTGCPANMVVPTDAGACSAVVNWIAPTVADNCDATPTVSSTHLPGATFVPGPAQTVTYTAEDDEGNIQTCSFTVTVIDATPPVFTTCPPDVTMPVSATTCDAVVTWAAPGATDNCDATPAITSTHTPGTLFTVGVYTVQYYAEDDTGNRDTCSFTITVIDDTPPAFSACPSNITVPVSAGSCLATVNWLPPVATDHCDATPAVTSTHVPGASLGLGLHTVQYYAQDDSGNRDTCTFVVTVIDATPPVFTGCPGNITLPVNPVSCNVVASWVAPTIMDYCDATPLLSSTHLPGVTLGLGLHTISYFAEDAAGNKDTCTFTITVVDATPPAFAGTPANMTYAVDPGLCTVAVPWTEPTVTDLCDASPVVTRTHAPGALFGLGVHTVRYRAQDAAGNRDSVSFTVTVVDDTPPLFTGCPANMTVNAVTCNATVNWAPPVATDNCDASVNITSTHTPGVSLGLGLHTVAYYAQDDSGNRDTCSFTVNVVDAAAPVFAGCPASFTVPVNASCTALVNWVPPSVTDNCDATPAITSTHLPGTAMGLGVYTVSYYAQDASGNRDTCSFVVTVVDATAPVFAGCPSGITVPVNPLTCSVSVNWTPPTASDNCDTSPVITGTHTPGATLGLGLHTVSYYVEDDSGNRDTCSFVITVIDDTRPAFGGCPVDMTVAVSAASCNAVVNWAEPTATDNCDASPTVTRTLAPGATLGLGVHSVSYYVEDDIGNRDTCTFTITVIDDTAPVFTGCPANLTVPADAAQCGVAVNWLAPTATDNCTILTITSSHEPGDFFPVGLTTVTYHAEDQEGNFAADCSFIVTVNDVTPPVFTGCPGAITVSAGPLCQAIITWADPVATDNCGATVISSHTSGETFQLGATTVTYTATDAAGNTSTCSFNVVVQDDIDPVFNNCPSNITIASDAGACGANVNWTAPGASDNCTALPVITATHAPGAFFAVGSATTVTYTAVDAAGNTVTCAFTVTVNDITPPVFQNCPAGITVAADDACGAVVSWPAVTATDHCGIASIASSRLPGERFEIGPTEIVYTATDVNGNVATCQFTVRVRNEEQPEITGCPEDISIKVGESGEGAVTWQPPIASTRCGVLSSLVGSRDPGEIFSIGTTAVTYTATNDAGVSVSCTFNVNVAYDDLVIDVVKVVTPDGDGVNDAWTIDNIENFGRNNVMVVDRWGSVIYQATGYNNNNVVWRGTNNGGGLVPAGTYFYVIEVNFLEQRLKKSGFIELIR